MKRYQNEELVAETEWVYIIHVFGHYTIEGIRFKYAMLFLIEPTRPLKNADHGGSYHKLSEIPQMLN